MKKKQEESQLLLRLSPELAEDLKHFAEWHERSVNGQIVWVLRQYVEQQKKEEEKAKMVALIDQVKPLTAWKKEIEEGKQIFHATLPYERVGKVEGKYVHEYDNITGIGTRRPVRKFKDMLYPKYFDTFEELLASCDARDLWADTPTTEAFISRMKDMFESLEEYVIEPDMDEKDIEAIPEDIRLTRTDLETIKEYSEEYFAGIRQKGINKWHEDMQKDKGEK